jgi:hypothetical protein
MVSICMSQRSDLNQTTALSRVEKTAPALLEFGLGVLAPSGVGVAAPEETVGVGAFA